ncbi:MAG: APC family permease, partial [Bacteroidota bacterium]
MGLTGLVATGVCSMMGASIYIVPFMIHRSVPGIGPYVLAAWLFAVLPALLAALAYASLASAMPRAGGSYIYASRALNPYLGFVASFSQWFGLCMAIGVVSYVIVPFLRDMFAAGGLEAWAAALDTGPLRLGLSLAFLWTFVWVNLRGISLYERTLIPLMGLMFGLGAIVIVAGFGFDHADFGAAIGVDGAVSVTDPKPFDLTTFFAAGAILFTSFIGFDSIAQAGGEARNPTKLLPRAIILAVLIVMTFDFL